jgi:predicted amidophosphoribosyltransferase
VEITRQSQSLTALFNRVAGIAAGTVRAPVAIVTLRQARRLCMIGVHGIYLEKFDESWSMGAELVRRPTLSFVPYVRRDPNFRDHPLLKAAPFARSLIHIPVQGQYVDLEAAITVINPELKWPFNAATTAVLNDLAMLVGDALSVTDVFDKPEPRAKPHRAPDLQETGTKGPENAGSHDTAGQFLLSTLAARTSTRNRKDISYVTLRTWTKQIKDHQLSALKIVKAHPNHQFVNDVASEMAEHIGKLFGAPRIGCVVPVPRHDDCLSVQISRSLAEKLSVPFINALQHTPRQGRAYPRKNAVLDMPKLVSDSTHEAVVLLVDDVATSGRHIELAVQSLRTMARHVTAMAWIGAA